MPKRFISIVKFNGFSPFLPAFASSIFCLSVLPSSVCLGGDLRIFNLVYGPPILPARIPVFFWDLSWIIDLIKSDARFGFGFLLSVATPAWFLVSIKSSPKWLGGDGLFLILLKVILTFFIFDGYYRYSYCSPLVISLFTLVWFNNLKFEIKVGFLFWGCLSSGLCDFWSFLKMRTFLGCGLIFAFTSLAPSGDVLINFMIF